jgi:hypothetical protein
LRDWGLGAGDWRRVHEAPGVGSFVRDNVLGTEYYVRFTPARYRLPSPVLVLVCCLFANG